MTAAFVAMYMATIPLMLPCAADIGDPTALTVTADDTAKATEQITRLNDDDVNVRLAAKGELAKQGWKALPALEAATKEMAKKAEYYLALESLTAEARRARFDLAYPIFLVDKERKFKHEFLGWNELVAAAGDTDGSRHLMADILAVQDRIDLMRACASLQRVAHKAIDAYWLEIGRARFLRQPPVYVSIENDILDSTAGLVAELVVPGEIENSDRKDIGIQWRGRRAGGSFGSVEAKKLMGEGSIYGTALKSTVYRWIETRKSIYGLYDADTVCLNLRADRVVWFEVNRKIVEYPETQYPTRNGAFAKMALFDAKKTLPILRKFFDDCTATKACDGKSEWQVRDGALAVTLAAQGIDPKAYGFWYQLEGRAEFVPEDKTVPRWNARFDGHNYCLREDDLGTTEAKRKVAFAKYAELEKSQKKTGDK